MHKPGDFNKTNNHTLYYTIGKITVDKLTSTLSKMEDDTATAEDRKLAALLQEIAALAKNRLSVAANETEFSKGSSVWVERTAQSHFPHIRLHGGALEDYPLKS
ncbi:MAG: hypothetical protein WCI23_03525 [Chlorobiaceae bacterium]